jgi:hypothetical protein
MEGPNFDPALGEKVRFKESLQKRPGIFTIVGVHGANDKLAQSDPLNVYGRFGMTTVDLRPEGKGLDLAFMPLDSLQYVDETRDVRRTIEWLKTSPDNRKYPDYIVDYEVQASEDHEGRPSIFVRFFIDSDYFYENGRASKEKVVALNEFLDAVRDELISLDLDRWISVRVGEARRALDVAS